MFFALFKSQSTKGGEKQDGEEKKKNSPEPKSSCIGDPEWGTERWLAAVGKFLVPKPVTIILCIYSLDIQATALFLGKCLKCCLMRLFIYPKLTVTFTSFWEEERVPQELILPTQWMKHLSMEFPMCFWTDSTPMHPQKTTTNTNSFSLTLSRVADSHCLTQCPALTSYTFLEEVLGLVWLWMSPWILQKLSFE